MADFGSRADQLKITALISDGASYRELIDGGYDATVQNLRPISWALWA